MEEQATQVVQTSQADAEKSKHSHKVLYTSLSLLLGTVVLLLFVVGTMILGSVKNSTVQPQGKISESTTSTASAVQNTKQAVTPVPITTKQDLTTQQNALDSADMTEITAGLDQNSKDASQFAQ